MSGVRIGQGFDLHRLLPAENGVIALAGVQVPAPFEVVAHSDGDVAIHALCDALLGALALGDIGLHFSDRDPQWQGADSRHFLKHIAQMVVAQGYRVGNVDITILAEVPKVSPHVAKMRVALAECLGVLTSQVSVKATTMEGLGDIGQRAALAAQAIVLLERLPEADVQSKTSPKAS